MRYENIIKTQEREHLLDARGNILDRECVSMRASGRIKGDKGGDAGGVDPVYPVQIEDHVPFAQQGGYALDEALIFAANQFGQIDGSDKQRHIGLAECGVHINLHVRATVTETSDTKYRSANGSRELRNCTRAAKSRNSEFAEIIGDTGTPNIGFTAAGVRFSVAAFASEHAARYYVVHGVAGSLSVSFNERITQMVNSSVLVPGCWGEASCFRVRGTSFI